MKRKKKILFSILSLCLIIGFFYFIRQDRLDEEVNTNNTEISSSYPYFSPEEKIQRSYLVVEAKYKGHLPPFKIKPTHGGAPLIYKDSKFEVVKVFKGEAKENDLIKIRSLGGKYKGESTSSEFDSISYNGSQNYLFFLTKFPFDPYKTEGDYFSTVTGPHGIFVKEEDGTYRGIEDKEEQIDSSLLESSNDTTNPRDIYVKQLEESFERGQITQAEYEDTLAEEDRFANIVE